MWQGGMHGGGVMCDRQACMVGGRHVWQGVCMVGGMCGRRRPLQRAVRILLECILVTAKFECFSKTICILCWPTTAILISSK